MSDFTTQEERLIAIRQNLYRGGLEDAERMAEAIPDPDLRRSVCAHYASLPFMPFMDLANDKHFGQALIGIRMHFNTLDDFESKMDDLALAVARAIDASLEGKGAETLPPENLQDAPREAGAKIGAAGKEVKSPTAPTAGGSPSGAIALTDPYPKSSIALFKRKPGSADIFLPALLAPPPPGTSGPGNLLRWLEGDPEASGGISILLRGKAWMAKVPDLEIDLTADTASFLSASGVKRSLDEEMFSAYGIWAQEEAARDMRAFSFADAAAVKRACEKVIEVYFPEHPGALSALDASLAMSTEAMAMISFAQDLEAHYFEDVDPEMEAIRQDQDLISSTHPDRSFRRGLILDQAFARFFVASMPFNAALGLSIVEMRDAQASRLAGGWGSDQLVRNFDQLFFEDCRRPLSEFILEPEISLEM